MDTEKKRTVMRRRNRDPKVNGIEDEKMRLTRGTADRMEA